jgi:L-lactate dehydrogenase complex protein LldF
LTPHTKDFIPAAQVALADPALRKAVLAGTMRPYTLARQLLDETTDKEALRSQSRAARIRALRNLPTLLEQLEENMTRNGGKVLWASDAAEANRLILDLCRRKNVRLVAKSKSMVTEEIGLNHALEDDGIEVVETDLGEYIIQIAGETPSHIIAPVIHRSKESIGSLLTEKLGMPATDDPSEMMRFVRGVLREKFLRADMGLSGCNFAVAETGGICIITNEGNGRMVTTLPRIHVAVMGLERIVATWFELATLVQILPRAATGQRLTTYINLIHGPRRAGDTDGPEELYLVIVDNGRSRILASDYAEALLCIRCGACLNACPVYRRTGGHAYGWVYPGPIGAVIDPLLLGLAEAPDLPHASSLCGACKDACPVRIDLPEMLVKLRGEPALRKKAGFWAHVAMQGWEVTMLLPPLYRMATRFSHWFLRAWTNDEGWIRDSWGPWAAWTKSRDLPAPAPILFRDLYKKNWKS